MTMAGAVSSHDIRAARLENAKMRERDLSAKLGITEAQLVAAHVGDGVTRLRADLDALMAATTQLGEVMSLTRNESCVIEKVGVYDNYKSGAHAALIVNEEIDLRMFPNHWVHAFAVEKKTEHGPRRSLQVFDAAGDAIHKIHLRDASNHEAWPGIVESLKHEDQSDSVSVTPRVPTEGPKGDPAKADTLRAEWDKLTDTHQFLQMTRKLKMNRLGAYRMAGAPYVCKLKTNAVETLLHEAAETGVPIMIFVGNSGCIEIHTGPVKMIVEMGPWINVLDPGHDLHLRKDHIAEVWAVTKSTRRGPAISVEAFDADGWVIAQFFGVLRQEGAAEQWNALVASLEEEKEAELV
ncbi:ChuX/HutX family heme-like substrate-binding protein [Shimia thalassica]|uniref:hemin-degrading factor n=1 Tax=Shimia thalassica TaxID=1715693 RepID=UPI0026E2C36D|nr:ChuX/HutX family heme-like substrate-binding protein [Shimia thalassica]MDO6523507.1 ChuX/HutX family heme-like substrate-binding protein [Shimia thalassica]